MGEEREGDGRGGGGGGREGEGKGALLILFDFILFHLRERAMDGWMDFSIEKRAFIN